MKHDEIQELLGAYALDAVDPDEAAEVEAHLATCSRCGAEVEEHREVAGLLAHTGTNAPDGLWDRISGALESDEPPLRLVPARPADSRPAAPAATAPAAGNVVPIRRAWVARSLVAGAVAAALIAVLGIQVVRQEQRLDQMEHAVEKDPARRAYELALAEAGSRVVELRNEQSVVATAVLTRDGEAWLDASQLPALTRESTYQLWGDAGEVLVSLGVLGADPDVVHFDARGYQALAVTAERAPGVVISEQPPVASGAVTA